MSNPGKARYWEAILYPENMRDDWQEAIDDLLQLPYAYCIHDKDFDSENDDRKLHVHLIIAFANSTTYKHAVEVFSFLNASGKSSFSTIESCRSIRYCYNYLIHDTDKAKKDGKHLYDKSERIVGNGFDIGSYEQITTSDKLAMCKELADIIMRERFIDFGEFYMYVVSNFDSVYFEVVKTNSGFYERLIKSNYQAFYRAKNKAQVVEIKKLLNEEEEKG